MKRERRQTDRRTFLRQTGACLAGVTCASAGMELLSPSVFAAEPSSRREVDFYEKLDEKTIRCSVCPHRCVLQPRGVGFCRARFNDAGTHVSKAYGNPCILRVDPVEKLPLAHFLPGTKMLTVSEGGCNLRCLYCQNWEQSQTPPEKLKTFDLPVEEAIRAAKKKGLKTIGFTYTEPVAYIEYITDIARAAKKAKLNVAVGSAFHVNPDPLIKLAENVDAFSITLKGFEESFYRDVCSVKLDNVLKAITTLKKRTKSWFELINLIVPTYNDNQPTIREMARWIKSELGADTPLHFARFVPMYRLKNLPRTPVQTLEASCQTARSAGLKYVYTANIAPHKLCNTFCPKCGEELVSRLGTKVLSTNLNKKDACPKCRSRLPGLWS